MFNPGRLELARQRRRYTARSLAERAQIAPVTLSRIVNGVQEADDETIEKLVRALGFPKSFFFDDDVDPIDASAASFRSLKAMTARERDAAIASGSLAYLVTDWVNERFHLPDADLLDLSHEHDPSSAAKSLRQYWAMGEKPVGNMVKLLETKGIRVFSLSENTKNVDAFSCWRNSEPYVFLNTFKTAERSRFDAAHELGHLVLHRHGGPKQGRNAEFEANTFASAFLMPENDVRSRIPYVSKLDEIITAKKRWGTSAIAVTYRLHKLGILSDWQYRTFCQQISARYGRTEPDGLPQERSSVWHMVLTELWKDGVSRSRIASELNIPSEEMDNLLFGLTGDVSAPERLTGRPSLKVV